MGRQKTSTWVADFETTTKLDDCRVWAWGLGNVDTATTAWDVEMGQDIDSFIKRISSMPSIIYFHNLGFDGVFLLDWMFRNGYHHVDKYPRNMEFTTLISDMGQWYSMTVVWSTGMKTEFRDSYKKLPYKVSVIAEAFKLPEAKGTIDYHAERPVGHRLTWDEKKYLASDVLIVCKAMKTQLDSGMKKLTVGSDSLADFKTTIGVKLFQRTWPVLSETMDAEIRKALRGGFTYSDERFSGKVTRSGRTYDVNSLYPSVMYNEWLPYGVPVYVDGLPVATPERPLFIVSITFTARLKKDRIPCIQVKGSSRFIATEYQRIISEPVTLSCTNVDLALWEEHYDMDILSYNGGWSFFAIQGAFKGYIDKWNKVKMESTGGMRALAKLMLNSLFGKFGTNPNMTGRVPIFEDNVVKFETGPHETKDPIYTAMSVFITSYARAITIRTGQENYDVFAYADTDSLHLLTDVDPANLWVDPLALGAWKFEYAFSRALFLNAKRYIEHKAPEHHHTAEKCKLDEHGPGCEYETHIAGMPVPVSEKLTIEDFVGGRKFDGKLTPKRVAGGVVLIDVGYTLPMW